MITVDPECSGTYPGLCVGFLALDGVSSATGSGQRALDLRRAELEAELRRRLSGIDKATLATLPPFPAYAAYYKRFKKTYHVLLQLESVALKGRAIASPGALVQAMFMAELESRLLTAGHDLDSVEGPIVVRAAAGHEEFITLDGQERRLKADDLHMADNAGVISSIIYGPDSRTRIHPGTGRVLYTVYGVPGIEPKEIELHLERLGEYVTLAAPDASVEERRVLTTS